MFQNRVETDPELVPTQCQQVIYHFQKEKKKPLSHLTADVRTWSSQEATVTLKLGSGVRWDKKVSAVLQQTFTKRPYSVVYRLKS